MSGLIDQLSITNPTSYTSQDGSVNVVSFIGTDPKTYSLTNFTNDEGQNSNVFSNIVAGVYTVGVKDAVGATDSETFRIEPTQETYGIRWYYEYATSNSQAYRLEILERGYTGAALLVKGAESHVKRGEGSDIYESGIDASTVPINLTSESQKQYWDILQGDDEQFQVKKYIQGSGWELIWQGFVTPAHYSEQLFHTPFNTSISSYDRLGDLQNIAFRETVVNDEIIPYTGRVTHLYAIIMCLEKIKIRQGYRVAVNTFNSTHTTTDDSPLNQTTVDLSLYYEEDTETTTTTLIAKKVEKCKKVITDILSIYKATLFSWGGFWYIVDKEEWLNSQINYVEYDSLGVFVSSSSWSPRIEFKRPGVATQWRWMGSQSFSASATYGQAVLSLATQEKETGILNDSTLVDDTVIGQTYEDGTKTQYYLYQDNVKYDRDDKFKIHIKVTVNIRVNESIEIAPPYIPLKWSFQVGTKYVDTGGEWSTSQTLNEYFITEFNEETEIEITLPYDDVNFSTDSYYFRAYIPNLLDHNVSATNETDMLTALRAVATVNSTNKARIITRIASGAPGSSQVFYFYELSIDPKAVDGAFVVQPDDYNASTNNKRWELVQTSSYSTASFNLPKTTVDFELIKLGQLPGGLEPKEVLPQTIEVKENNKQDYEVESNLFDPVSGVNNSENIYKNILKDTAGTPTSQWTKTGGTISKTLAEWRLDWIKESTKQARKKVNGSLKTDIPFTPINTLYNTDDGEILYGQGVTSDWRSNTYKGEIVEIGHGLLAPSNLVLTPVTDTEVILTWSDNSIDETAFELQISTTLGIVWSHEATIQSNGTTYTDSGLTTGTNYAYRVRAIKDQVISEWSNIADMTLSPWVLATGEWNGSGNWYPQENWNSI